MNIVFACAAAALLTGCATMRDVDVCKSAPQRRLVYTTAITAADVLVFSGRPVPQAVTLGREAAVTALAILDHNCPMVAHGVSGHEAMQAPPQPTVVDQN